MSKIISSIVFFIILSISHQAIAIESNGSCETPWLQISDEYRGRVAYIRSINKTPVAEIIDESPTCKRITLRYGGAKHLLFTVTGTIHFDGTASSHNGTWTVKRFSDGTYTEVWAGFDQSLGSYGGAHHCIKTSIIYAIAKELITPVYFDGSQYSGDGYGMNVNNCIIPGYREINEPIDQIDSYWYYKTTVDCDGFEPSSQGGAVSATVNGDTITDDSIVYYVPCDKEHCMDVPGWHQDDNSDIADGCQTNTFQADGITYTETMCFSGARRTTTQKGSDGSHTEECIIFYYYSPDTDGLSAGTNSGVPGSVGTGIHGGEGDGTGAGNDNTFPNQSSIPTMPTFGNKSSIKLPPFQTYSTATAVGLDDIYKSKGDTYRAKKIDELKQIIHNSFPLNIVSDVQGFFSGLNQSYQTSSKPTSAFTLTVIGYDCGTMDPLGKMADVIEPIRPTLRAFFTALSTLMFMFACLRVIRQR